MAFTTNNPTANRASSLFSYSGGHTLFSHTNIHYYEVEGTHTGRMYVYVDLKGSI